MWNLPEIKVGVYLFESKYRDNLSSQVCSLVFWKKNMAGILFVTKFRAQKFSYFREPTSYIDLTPNLRCCSDWACAIYSYIVILTVVLGACLADTQVTVEHLMFFYPVMGVLGGCWVWVFVGFFLFLFLFLIWSGKFLSAACFLCLSAALGCLLS